MSSSSSASLVSIGIPTYNRAKDLSRCLESALGQDYSNLEIVISDNGSTDETEAHCRELAGRDGRLRYIRQPQNKGAHANFRTVFAESRGEFFMWLGDDDWLEPHYVSTCIGAFQRDDSIVCGYDRYFTNGTFTFEGPRLNLREGSGRERVLAYYRQVTVNGTFYGLMRRGFLAQIETSNALGGDWLLVAAMAYLGKVKTLDSVSVCRSTGGVSQDLNTLATKLGMSDLDVEDPLLAVASTVFRDIAWECDVYRGLRLHERLLLAVHASRTVIWRNYPRGSMPTILRYFMRSALSRVRAAS